MPNPLPRVNTHQANGQRLSRLSQWRMKKAKLDRDRENQEANDRYAARVAAILSRDRPSTLALVKHQTANFHGWRWRTWPVWISYSRALAQPYQTELDNCAGSPWAWFATNVAELLQRHGYVDARPARPAIGR